jgi:hypothetical protein
MKRTILALVIGFLLMGSNLFAADGDLIVNGNLGVGTTPSYKLEVSGSYFLNNGNQGAILSSTQGYLKLRTGSTALTIENNAGSSSLISILNGGSVGIGTTSPFSYAKLSLEGNNIFIRQGTSNQHSNWSSFNYGLAFADGTGNDSNGPGALITATRGDGYGADLQFVTRADGGGAAVERVKILRGGDVGIGNSATGGFKLYVEGAAYASGNWWTSDIRYKENIAPIESPLSKVLNIKGVSFNWKVEQFKQKGFPTGRHYGVISQDIEKVLPNVIKQGVDGEKCVSYTELVPLLIEAVKEQQAEIEGLKTELQSKGSIPQGLVAFVTGKCPTGWTENAALTGNITISGKSVSVKACQAP